MNALHAPAGRRPDRRGFTLLELMISASIFSTLAYALTQAVRMADRSHATVTHVASTSRALGKATAKLQRELKSAQVATMTVTETLDGNHEVTFLHPVTVAGDPVWGVRDKRLGPTAAEQNKLDWQLRYTVRDEQLGAGQSERHLLRQVLDDAGVVQLEDRLLRDLTDGPTPPGFTIVQNGDVWEITLTTAGEGVGDGRESVFQVRPRN